MLTPAHIAALRRRVSHEKLDSLAHFFEALSDPRRLCVFRLFMDGTEVCVTDVARICGVSVPAASQQLKILERVGLIKRYRMGQVVCYRIRQDNYIIKMITAFLRKAEKGRL